MKHLLDQTVPIKNPLGNYIDAKFDEYGFLHSANSPAVTYPDGSKLYYWHGWLHRLDGYACDKPNMKHYYIQGRYIQNELTFKRMARLWKLKFLGF